MVPRRTMPRPRRTVTGPSQTMTVLWRITPRRRLTASAAPECGAVPDATASAAEHAERGAGPRRRRARRRWRYAGRGPGRHRARRSHRPHIAAGEQNGDPSAASEQAQDPGTPAGGPAAEPDRDPGPGLLAAPSAADRPLGSSPSAAAFSDRRTPTRPPHRLPSRPPGTRRRLPRTRRPPRTRRAPRTRPGTRQGPAGPRPSASAPGAPQPGRPAGRPGNEPGNEPGRVIVVTGVPRYHRPGCILIRFLGKDDVESITREAAEASGCVPCRACQPDKLSSAAESGVTGWG